MSLLSLRRLLPALCMGVGLALSPLIPPRAAASGSPRPAGRSARGGGGASIPLPPMAAALAARWKVPILIDPAIGPSARVERPDPNLSVDAALDTVLAPLRHVSWRRVYLPLGETDRTPPVELLAAVIRSLERPDIGSLLLEDPAAKQVTGRLNSLPIAPSLAMLLREAKLSTEPIYLIFRTEPWPEEPRPEQQIADLQRQQMALPLPAERQALAMAQMVGMLQALAPAEREAFASRTLAAGMRLWDSTPAGQRNEMIQQSLQLMQAFGAPPGARGPVDDHAPPVSRPEPPAAAAVRPVNGPPGNSRAFAAALTERYGAPFLIDPGLLLPPAPGLPRAELSAEEALAAVLSTLQGAAGRRLYFPAASKKRQLSPERWATTARELEDLAPCSLLVENPATNRATLYLKNEPATSLARLVVQGKLSDEPLYLLYSTAPAARGGTLAERVADLQRQQMGLLLRMSPEEMAQAAEPVLRAFPSADPQTRARLMGLPAMAALMAAWMPRAAKEQGQPLAP